MEFDNKLKQVKSQIKYGDKSKPTVMRFDQSKGDLNEDVVLGYINDILDENEKNQQLNLGLKPLSQEEKKALIFTANFLAQKSLSKGKK